MSHPHFTSVPPIEEVPWSLNVDGDCRCVVIEDTHIGLRAARAAGMRCVVTTSSYTADEDFAIADAVFDSISDNFSVLDLTTPGKLTLCGV